MTHKNFAIDTPILDKAAQDGVSPEEVVLDALNSADTVKDAAEQLGVAIRTVYWWIGRSDIKRVWVMGGDDDES